MWIWYRKHPTNLLVAWLHLLSRSRASPQSADWWHAFRSLLKTGADGAGESPNSSRATTRLLVQVRDNHLRGCDGNHKNVDSV